MMARTYKKVLNFAAVSTGAGVQFDYLLAKGVDSLTLGQSGATDATIPTGSKIQYIEIALADSNIVAAAAFVNLVIQYTLNAQSLVPPNAVGGNPQRNQVLHQQLFVMGQNQNSNHLFRFKIPGKFQRIKEGMEWNVSTISTGSHVHAMQVIYKVLQ